MPLISMTKKSLIFKFRSVLHRWRYRSYFTVKLGTAIHTNCTRLCALVSYWHTSSRTMPAPRAAFDGTCKTHMVGIQCPQLKWGFASVHRNWRWSISVPPQDVLADRMSYEPSVDRGQTPGSLSWVKLIPEDFFRRCEDSCCGPCNSATYYTCYIPIS